MKLEHAKAAVTEYIDNIAPLLWALSLDLHKHPEVAFKEKRSSAQIAQFLEERGFQLERGVAGLPTAFRAKRPARGKNKPAVSYMSEYDALPGLGHACGHNLIAMASAGAGAALANVLKPEVGEVQVLGTPAEEGGGGKVIMANKGLFQGLDANMMMHPSMETRAEVNFLALAELRFYFYGKASHASAWSPNAIVRPVWTQMPLPRACRNQAPTCSSSMPPWCSTSTHVSGAKGAYASSTAGCQLHTVPIGASTEFSEYSSPSAEAWTLEGQSPTDSGMRAVSRALDSTSE